MNQRSDGELPPPFTPEGPERDALVDELLENARDFLDEALSLDPRRQGRSLVHTAYYAIFWLARAVVTRMEGTYPHRHSSLMDHVAAVVAQDGAQHLVEAYGLFPDAVKERGVCDYDRRHRPSPERAAEILEGVGGAFVIFGGRIGVAPKG